MLSTPRHLLILLPIPLAYFMSDRTMANFFAMFIGGLVFWIPYWLALWLSDGFKIHSAWYFDESRREKWITVPPLSYRNGPQGMGLFSGEIKIDG